MVIPPLKTIMIRAAESAPQCHSLSNIVNMRNGQSSEQTFATSQSKARKNTRVAENVTSPDKSAQQQKYKDIEASEEEDDE